MFFYYSQNISDWSKITTVGERLLIDNASFRPYTSSGITYDFNNSKAYVDRSRTTTTLGIGYPVASAFSNFSTAYLDGTRTGFPYLLTSVERIDDYSNIELQSGIISGKYRLPGSIVTEYDIGGSTIKVDCEYNGKHYDYIALTSRNPWNSPSGYNNEDVDPQGSALGFIKGSYANSIDLEIYNWSSHIGNIIDFGTYPQIVPLNFANFITSNFTPIYQNSFTIKSSNGVNTLYELNEAPTMVSGLLTVIGNHKTLNLTGSNGIIYELSWDSETPSGTIFTGLSFSKNSKISNIPVGVETEFNLTGDVILYEAYGVYRPPATTFSIELYRNSAEANRVDKTDFLTAVGSLNGVMREGSSITDLSITFEMGTLPQFNYAYIPSFNRYYYVNDITSVRYNLWEMSLQVDPLMTYKDAILSCTGFVDRNESDYNPDIIDKKRVIEQGHTIEYDTVTNELFTSTQGSYALTGILVSVDISSAQEE